MTNETIIEKTAEVIEETVKEGMSWKGIAVRAFAAIGGAVILWNGIGWVASKVRKPAAETNTAAEANA